MKLERCCSITQKKLRFIYTKSVCEVCFREEPRDSKKRTVKIGPIDFAVCHIFVHFVSEIYLK